MIAVLGTLSGAVLTYAFGRRAAERANRVAHRAQLRVDRIAAYLAFVEAVTELKRAAYDRWHRQHDDSDQQTVAEATAAHYRSRSAADHALLRIRLLHPDATDAVTIAANDALNTAGQVHHATNSGGLAEMGDRAAGTAHDFIGVAAVELE